MRQRCPTCAVEYSEESKRIYRATGQKFCEDCNVHELIDHYRNIDSLNQKGWKWRNYYGVVPDNSSGNVIRRIVVPNDLIVPKNICFECKINNRMSNILLCEDCIKKYDSNCNTNGLTEHCKFCSTPSSNSYCNTCIQSFERRQIILLTLSISEKLQKKNESTRILSTKKEQTFSLNDCIGGKKSCINGE